MLKKKKGFSLIELLVTIAIIGILSAIVVPIYMGQARKAAFSEAKTNLLVILQEQTKQRRSFNVFQPNPDATITNAGIQAVLPGFRPGNFADLYFNYQVTTTNNGTQFVAVARGKANLPAAQGAVFTINQLNQRSW